MTKTSEGSNYRIITVMAVMSAAGLVLVGQLIRWQVLEHHRFAALAVAEHQNELVIPPHRGEIHDRNGHILAADMIQYDISASPKIISDPYAAADRLYRLLDMPRDELLRSLSSDSPWVPLAKAAPQAVGESIIEWDRCGLQAEPRSKRFYPVGVMGAHLLGFVNINVNCFYGVE
jgi:cell division protein FtsI/penicillin-binding protein 2